MVNTVNILGFPHAYELSAPTDSSTVLVFVHGWLLSRAYWQPLIENLSQSYQCLTYDMRGFGESQMTLAEVAIAQRPVMETAAIGAAPNLSLLGNSDPLPANGALSTSYGPAAYAQDLVLLLQTLNISNAWLVGHSLGGSIALWAAERSPERVAGVVCINAGGGIYLKEEFEKFRSAGQQLINFRPAWLSYVPFLDRLLTRLNVAQPLDCRWGKQRLQDLLCAQAEAAIGTLLGSTTEAEVHLLPQVVSRLRQPVHFIAGANDTVMEPQYVNHLASFHPSFEACGNNVSTIPDCGHLAMVEQPDAAANEIRAILAKHDAF